MTTTAATAATTIHQGDSVRYQGSITNLHGMIFTVISTYGGVLALRSGNRFIGETVLSGVRLTSVTKY